MQALFDADVLLYELGFASEVAWKGMCAQRGEECVDPAPFELVAEMLEGRINNTLAVTEANEEPLFFFTGKTNFRNAIAKKQKYKDRPSNKPFHYNNIKAYIQGKYDWRIQEGLEADDLMSLEQVKRGLGTIICTRDKDLRAVPGWHYGWELGNQPQFGPLLVEGLGDIRLSDKRDKIEGYGELFFYAQCITGDRVDSIPGLPGKGAVFAFETLQGRVTSKDAFKAVLEAYRAFYGPSGDEELLEQGRLLHMTRSLHEDGSPVLWEFPNGE